MALEKKNGKKYDGQTTKKFYAEKDLGSASQILKKKKRKKQNCLLINHKNLSSKYLIFLVLVTFFESHICLTKQP